MVGGEHRLSDGFNIRRLATPRERTVSSLPGRKLVSGKRGRAETRRRRVRRFFFQISFEREKQQQQQNKQTKKTNP